MPIYVHNIAVQEITLFRAARLCREARVKLLAGPKQGCPVSQHDTRWQHL